MARFRLIRGRSGLLLTLAAAATCGIWTTYALAADALVVVRVEEDWELVVSAPDVERNSPQVTCISAPQDSLGGDYGVFELNFGSLPEYVDRGMQVQLWSGEQAQAYKQNVPAGRLSHENETVTWTQSLCLEDGKLVFEVSGGQSQSWGSFGGNGTLKISKHTTLGSLNEYRPWFSTQHSGVGFGGNRVLSLTLKRTRFILSTGDVYEFQAPFEAHQYSF